ncbi:hypothetical protein QKG08_15000 [Clavibacter michiganensis]|uniref:hypothetical protein n=1 Tax=Clavibacter michiganensis TaxID=28447 RepID=UPI0026DD59DA|nr:hypothetical protein [Clavibacter michiganensis]MDO4070360.1 hypothetical protein [Clavibacter michiganensis]
MQTQKRPFRSNVASWLIAVGASGGLGACIGTVADGRWTSDWVAATGTWAGSIGTVAALLWAVASFRSDQADRDRFRAEEASREEERQEQEAGQVSIVIDSGWEFRDGLGLSHLGSFSVLVTNKSERTVIVKSFEVDPALTPKSLPITEFLVPAGESRTESVVIDSIRWSRTADAYGMRDLTIAMDCDIAGTTWHISNKKLPERVR